MAWIGLRRVALTLAGIAAFAAPIVMGLQIARRQAFETHRDRAGALAAEVLRQTDAIRRQLGQAFDTLEAAGVEPCSDAGIATMRAVALRSDRLAGVGFVEGDELRCSAFGRHDPPVPVGASDYRSPLRIDVRIDRELAFAPGPALVVATVPSGYTGLVHASHAIALAEDDPETSLAVRGRISGLRLVARGRIDPGWVDAVIRSDALQGARVLDDHIVAWRHSEVWDLTAYAVVPMAKVAREANRQALLLAPIGFVAGCALFLAGYRTVQQNNTLRALFRAGLGRKEIALHYQPIVDIASGRWVGAEALARWRRPTGEWVSPAIFIPIAERYGLMQPLTMHVLDLALAEIRPIVARDPAFFVSLNMGASDLASPVIHEHLTGLLRRHGLGPANVHIELTEREVVDSERVGRAIDRYRAMGIAVGIDDFGVGYSNLAHLESLTVDYLKIDRIFLAAANPDAGRKQTITYIIELAQEHGVGLVSEGVETEDQRAFLLASGVTLGQGWLFSGARPIVDLDRHHAENAAGYRPPPTSNSAPVT